MSVTCIVPVHNHWKTTAECLATIFKSGLTDYKVIVIDDVSTDLTSSFLKTVAKDYPITIITNVTNKGYLGSTNEALKIIDTEYIVFMNNDIHLDPDCLKVLIETYKKHPEIGILGATQYNKNWEEMSPLKFFLRGDKATIRDHIVTSNIPKDLKDSDVIFCDDVHFACALTSKKVVDKAGPLDIDYGLGNYEQESHALTIKELGYQIAICPKAKFIHYGSISVNDDIEKYSTLLNKNREIFFRKWGDKLKNGQI